jgi:Uncharacterized conserved protein
MTTTKFLLALLCAFACLLTASGETMSIRNKENPVRITITAGDIILTATLIDTPAARDFASLLPLSLALEDYASTEKIGYLPRKLTSDGAPGGYDPSVGDLAYYAPWGNLAIFYRDFGYAAGLVRLGKIDGGIEKISGKGKITALFEISK